MGILEDLLEKLKAQSARLDAVEYELKVAKAQLKASGDRITTAEALARTGYKDKRSLDKYFTPVEKNGTYTWSAAEIAEWLIKQELTKAA